MKMDLAVAHSGLPKARHRWGGGAFHPANWDWDALAGDPPQKEGSTIASDERKWALKDCLTLGLSYPPRHFLGPEEQARDAGTQADNATRRLSWALRNQNFQPTCVAHAVVACMELMEIRPTPKPDEDPIAPRYSVQSFYERMLGRVKLEPEEERAKDWQRGFTRLKEASEVLTDVKLEPGQEWKDEPPPHRNFEKVQIGYYPTPEERVPGIAKLVFDELCEHRPVAIALPAYAPHGSKDIANNWTRPSVLLSGNVEDPRPHEKPVPGSGHAVCVVGFLPNRDEHLGGYFVFRNSLGEDFATAPAPTVLARGYGTISATHVQKHCWELLSVKPKA